jgi:hypothetical protein
LPSFGTEFALIQNYSKDSTNFCWPLETESRCLCAALLSILVWPIPKGSRKNPANEDDSYLYIGKKNHSYPLPNKQKSTKEQARIQEDIPHPRPHPN